MIQFILNDVDIETGLPTGTTVLDFVRYHKNLKGTKIGCREGDCGACTIMVGELIEGNVRYRTMTSCLMPIANASGKHIVTIEGVNREDGTLTPVQQAIVDESGTQCGFCTVGFVMSLTGFCIDGTEKTPELAVSSIDGNICRCTGYKSLERAAARVCQRAITPALADDGEPAPTNAFVPDYFDSIAIRLQNLDMAPRSDHALLPPPRPSATPPPAGGELAVMPVTAGGTDVYVQRADELIQADATHVFYDDSLRGINENDGIIAIGASATVTDLLQSPVMQSIFPDLYKHLKLVSSTPIRNMATLGGNFVNASPIGDMTIWFLALDTQVVFNNGREMPLQKLYLDYKRLAKTDNELIKTIRFRKPVDGFYFNFEKVCKRTYLDIASVNTAMSLTVEITPGPGWIPPALRNEGLGTGDEGLRAPLEHKIISAHVSAGGVAPIPLYLKETSDFLRGQVVNAETIADANEIMQAEISPISDVRGSAEYKRLLLRQLFRAHFVEIFNGPGD